MNLVERALTLEGWMSPDEITWLHANSANFNLALEIGSWAGRSTTALLAATNVISVDHWLGDEWLKLGIGKRFHQDARRVKALFKHNLKAELESGKLQVIEADSQTATGVFIIKDYLDTHKLIPDMVFIDASHDYESVLNDIRLAKMISTPNALLCGHDYTEGFPGLMDAVQELCPEVESGPDAIWYWKKGQL